MKLSLALPIMVLVSSFAVIGCQKAATEGEDKAAATEEAAAPAAEGSDTESHTE